ncbi:uncharacterized protein LOC105694788 [Orussus abietinus]|uniref:uncharacterized protein LOC105694788 n=1 Tax=Orussus abietinus TaxID=222816 RepID=UPI0006266DAB|nr:uncharacterized protein LOC105694788 [Orussus abietinus]
MQMDAMQDPKKKSHPALRRNLGKLWHHFRVLTPRSSILQGSYAMTDPRFKPRSRGHQGTSCSVVAIVFGRLFEPKDWTSNYVDQTLRVGDNLFRVSQYRNRVPPGTYLTTNLVHPEFFVGDYKCSICVEASKVYGNLFSETTGCPGLSEGLQRFFRTSDAGVVTAQGTSIAIWRHKDEGFLYYDSSGCDEEGSRCREGTACLIRFESLDDLVESFLRNMDRKFDSRYCIDKVSVLRVVPMSQLMKRFTSEYPQKGQGSELVVDKKVLRAINPVDLEERKLDCTHPAPKMEKGTPKESSGFAGTKVLEEPLDISISNFSIDAKFAVRPLVDQDSFDTGYPYDDMLVNIPDTFRELPGDVAILHGWTHEGSDAYKGKGAQNVVNCAMSVAMKKVHPVRTWLRPKLDEILTLGDALYAEVKSEKPGLKSITATDLNEARFQIEGTKLILEVDLITVSGTISSKVPNVLNLKRALEEFFLGNTDGVIECSAMATAVWTQDDVFYMFDPRQCGPTGIRILEEKGKGGKGGKKDAKQGAGTEKKIKGKCCVMRFPNVEELVSLFRVNLDPAKRNDRFTVRRVKVLEDVAGSRPWNDFGPSQAGRWVLRGGITSEDADFEDESRGLQGLAIPVTGLVFAKETPPSKWTKETVDDAIKEGDAYFNWCIPPEEEGDRKLLPGTLKRTLYVKGRKVKIGLEESSVVGDLKAGSGGQTLDLPRGIAQFLQDRQFGVLQVGDSSVAVWKFEEELKDKTKETAYYLLHPNPRIDMSQKAGAAEEDLAGCVVRVLDPESLAEVVEKNLPATEESKEFSIHEVKILSVGQPMTEEEIEKDKEVPEKPDLNNFGVVGDDGACLNGSIDQANEALFKHRTRDKQQAANSIIALAMTRLYNPHYWNREVVDDIVKLGDKMTIDNIDAVPEPDEDDEVPRDYLLPSEVAKEFNIGVNKMTLDLEEEAAEGKLSDLQKHLEEFFEGNKMGIFRQGKVMMPVWKEGDVFFMMDPRGRDAQGNPKEKDGAASVLWFTSLSALAGSLQKSARSDDDFVIDSVTMETALESRGEELGRTTSTEELWHHFPKMEDGIWGFEGKVSMADERFALENRNKQSAAMAMMGVVFSKAYHPRQLRGDVLDEVVITGDKLHSKCVERLGSIPKVNDVLREFFISSRRISLTLKDCVEAGDIKGHPPKSQDLKTGLDNFFKNSSSGVLTIDGKINIAIWRYKDVYYCLVPGIPGADDQVTLPRVGRFVDTEKMMGFLGKILGDEGDYEITAVDVVDWNKLPPWKFDPSPAVRPANLPPLNAFRRLQGAARAILRGATHQASEVFPEDVRNQQTASNCVVALAMAVVKSPVTWTRSTLDEILVIGNNVHRETMKTLKTLPSVQRPRPQDVVRVFHLGVNVLTADVEPGAVTGQVAIPPPEPEVKGKKGKKEKKKKPPKKGKKGKTKREKPPPPPPILLEEGLSKFFQDNKAGVLVTGRYMAAIWKDFGVYFMYDPRARGKEGTEDQNGASCLAWFACMEPFYDLVFRNIDQAEKYGSYEICRVIIRTIVIDPLPCPAGFRPIQECTVPSIPVSSLKRTTTLNVETLTEFNRVDAGTSVLRGTLHLQHPSFRVSSRGLQATSMAAVAIVVGLLHVPSTWTPELIDAILKYGDVLHVDSARIARPGARNLSPGELLTVFVVGDCKASIHVHRHTAAGILHPFDLAEALVLFFRNNCSGILHTNNVATAVMQHYGMFYLFDPCSRNEAGRPCLDGAACVIKCDSVERMARIFVNNCNFGKPNVYTLNAVNVLSLHFFSGAKSECPPPCRK